ncbi:MAG TPA: hypothetical protein VNI01_08080 [Elusimicrobiota bacterium]|nr:hypothetical protein [Elusimicrobiota bacterium]
MRAAALALVVAALGAGPAAARRSAVDAALDDCLRIEGETLRASKADQPIIRELERRERAYVTGADFEEITAGRAEARERAARAMRRLTELAGLMKNAVLEYGLLATNEALGGGAAKFVPGQEDRHIRVVLMNKRLTEQVNDDMTRLGSALDSEDIAFVRAKRARSLRALRWCALVLVLLFGAAGAAFYRQSRGRLEKAKELPERRRDGNPPARDAAPPPATAPPPPSLPPPTEPAPETRPPFRSPWSRGR